MLHQGTKPAYENKIAMFVIMFPKEAYGLELMG